MILVINFITLLVLKSIMFHFILQQIPKNNLSKLHRFLYLFSNFRVGHKIYMPLANTANAENANAESVV